MPSGGKWLCYLYKVKDHTYYNVNGIMARNIIVCFSEKLIHDSDVTAMSSGARDRFTKG